MHITVRCLVLYSRVALYSPLFAAVQGTCWKRTNPFLSMSLYDLQWRTIYVVDSTSYYQQQEYHHILYYRRKA